MLKLLQILITDAYGKKLRYLEIFGAKRNWKGKEGINARLSLIYSIYVLVFLLLLLFLHILSDCFSGTQSGLNFC